MADEKNNGYIGARGAITLDFMRPVKVKDADGKEIDSNLMYQLILPVGAQWETVYEVLDCMIVEVKKMQEIAIKQSEELAKKDAKKKDKKEEPKIIDVKVEEN